MDLRCHGAGCDRLEEAEELFHTYLDSTFGAAEVERQREALLNFARKVELLPFAVSVGANQLRGIAEPLEEGALELLTAELRDGYTGGDHSVL